MRVQSRETVILGLGANQGDSRANIEKAIELLKEKDFKVNKVSSFYRASPVGNPDQPDFINAALVGRTAASPNKLLSWCQEIETRLGRNSELPRWSQRPIDIDILFYSGHVIRTEKLIVPHPRFSERLFAIVPAAEIAPDFRIPGGPTLREFLDISTREYDFSSQMVEKV